MSPSAAAILPINLEMSRLRVAVVGRDMGAVRRIEALQGMGCHAITVHSDAPSPYLQVRAGARLRRGLPTAEALSTAHLVYIVDLDGELAAKVAAIAREAGCLVSVDGDRRQSDFYSPRLVRRGDLVIGVDSPGRSAALARAAQSLLDRLFSGSWTDRVRSLGEGRERLRRAGAGAAAVLQAVEQEMLALEPERAPTGINAHPAVQSSRSDQTTLPWPPLGHTPLSQAEPEALASWAY